MNIAALEELVLSLEEILITYQIAFDESLKKNEFSLETFNSLRQKFFRRDDLIEFLSKPYAKAYDQLNVDSRKQFEEVCSQYKITSKGKHRFFFFFHYTANYKTHCINYVQYMASFIFRF